MAEVEEYSNAPVVSDLPRKQRWRENSKSLIRMMANPIGLIIVGAHIVLISAVINLVSNGMLLLSLPYLALLYNYRPQIEAKTNERLAANTDLPPRLKAVDVTNGLRESMLWKDFNFEVVDSVIIMSPNNKREVPEHITSALIIETLKNRMSELAKSHEWKKSDAAQIAFRDPRKGFVIAIELTPTMIEHGQLFHEPTIVEYLGLAPTNAKEEIRVTSIVKHQISSANITPSRGGFGINAPFVSPATKLNISRHSIGSPRSPLSGKHGISR